MTKGLRRFHASGQRHFITCSCYHRQQLLGSAHRRDLFLKILEETRLRYDFVVWGYVVMPEHFHLLISEPARGTVATVLQVLKQRVSRGGKLPNREAGPHPAFWQRRYHDFNVFGERKHVEKLRYLHRNPVKRGLVESPEMWRWSSFRGYLLGEQGAVRLWV
jgi:REP-associated tyrosine transposase